MIWLSQMTEIWKEDKVTYWKQTYWTQTATTKTKCLAGMQAVFCYSGSFKGQFIIIKNEIFKLFKLLQEKVSLHFESKVLHWKINSYSQNAVQSVLARNSRSFDTLLQVISKQTNKTKQNLGKKEKAKSYFKSKTRWNISAYNGMTCHQAEVCIRDDKSSNGRRCNCDSGDHSRHSRFYIHLHLQ